MRLHHGIDVKCDRPAALAGGNVSLADLHAAPMFVYFCMAKEGAELLSSLPRLARWWQSMRNRPSMTATRSPLE